MLDFLWNSPVAGILFSIAVAVLIFGVLVKAEKKFYPKKKSNVKYIQVPGKLIRIKQKFMFWRGGSVTLFIFRFTTEGGDVIVGTTIPPILNSLAMAEGCTVKIFYHPQNPYDFFVE